MVIREQNETMFDIYWFYSCVPLNEPIKIVDQSGPISPLIGSGAGGSVDLACQSEVRVITCVFHLMHTQCKDYFRVYDCITLKLSNLQEKDLTFQ